MPENNLVYSIQRTYILTPVLKSGNEIVTCDQRIDIPTIEPLSSVQPTLYTGEPLTVIPCIELAVEFMPEFLSEVDLTFETNEGVTVLPIKIASGEDDSLGNPYANFRYVLVLPKGATGVKSCKLTYKDTGEEVQHNFTFGIMPPPYNYDNVLFGYLIYNLTEIMCRMQKRFENLKVLGNVDYTPIDLHKSSQGDRINIEPGQLFFDVLFSYSSSSETSIHRPKITLHGLYSDTVYTLSLNKTTNLVRIDLFTRIITACDSVNGEIIQQFMIYETLNEFKAISFENFDDINTPFLTVRPRGRGVH